MFAVFVNLIILSRAFEHEATWSDFVATDRSVAACHRVCDTPWWGEVEFGSILECLRKAPSNCVFEATYSSSGVTDIVCPGGDIEKGFSTSPFSPFIGTAVEWMDAESSVLLVNETETADCSYMLETRISCVSPAETEVPISRVESRAGEPFVLNLSTLSIESLHRVLVIIPDMDENDDPQAAVATGGQSWKRRNSYKCYRPLQSPLSYFNVAYKVRMDGSRDATSRAPPRVSVSAALAVSLLVAWPALFGI